MTVHEQKRGPHTEYRHRDAVIPQDTDRQLRHAGNGFCVKSAADSGTFSI